MEAKYYLNYNEAKEVGLLLQEKAMKSRRNARRKAKAKKFARSLLVITIFLLVSIFIASIEGLTNIIIK